jgi:alpha-1,6-mannosyltransferase
MGSASAAALVCAAVLLWYLLWRFAHTDLTLPQRGAQITFFFLALAAFAVGVGIAWRLGFRASRRAVWFIVASGIVFRLSLAPARPVTTIDIYRYLWEGRLVNAGVNPFAHAPDSPELKPLRDSVWPSVRRRDVPAAYPPVAQYAFALADRIPADRITALKLVFAAFDIGTLLLLPGLLVRFRRPPVWVLVYAWHPLIVGEVVARGHFDSVGIFFLVLSARLLLMPARHWRGLAGAALAASVLGKGYAIVVLPFFLIAARPHRWWFAGGAAGFAAAAYLPFASAGRHLLDGMMMYVRGWHGYGSLFPAVERALATFTDDPAPAARWVCGIALAAWVLLLLVRQIRSSDRLAPLDSSFLALAGFYLLSSVLYPWYLSWTVPFLCFRPRPAWLLLTGSVYLFYAHPLAAPRGEVWWLNAIQYGAPLALAGALAAARAGGRERTRAEVRIACESK